MALQKQEKEFCGSHSKYTGQAKKSKAFFYVIAVTTQVKALRRNA